jgi:hypothetical protein
MRGDERDQDGMLVEDRNGLISAAMVTLTDGYAERDAALLMLAEKQEGRSRRITAGDDKAYDRRISSASAGVEHDAARYEERQKTHQQPGPQNHVPARLCRQPEPPMADRKGIRMAEANRPAAPGQVARAWRKWIGYSSSVAPLTT